MSRRPTSEIVADLRIPAVAHANQWALKQEAADRLNELAALWEAVHDPEFRSADVANSWGPCIRYLRSIRTEATP